MPVYLPSLTLGGFGYGGAPYGYVILAPLSLPPPFPGGYGGEAYGLDPYGSVDFADPVVSGASSLNGFQVEVFYSEEMKDDPALFAPGNYTFAPLFGAPLSVTSVVGGTPGDFGGWASVIVTHSGTTLGGEYELTVTGPEDLDGTPILPTQVSFYAFGDIASVSTSIPVPDTGKVVRLEFTDSGGFPQNLLPESLFSPGVEDPSEYSVSSDYPVLPVVASATQDSLVLSKVDLEVNYMTSTQYDLVVGPALAYAYEGGVLPDDDPEFTGVEVGTGTSSASLLSGLLLNKALGDTYGWEFLDLSGKLTPTATFRVDLLFDASSASIAPPVVGTILATLSVCDGTTQIDVYLADLLGTKILTVSSGAYSASVSFAWNLGECLITLIRNRKGGFYTLLGNGVPLLTFAEGSPTGAPLFAPGTRVLLGPAHSVALFQVREVRLTSSATIYTSAWNFVHGLTSTFVGSSVLTRDRILTKRGPLVRGWGDPTPAQKQDVEVRVNGVPVEVAGVNPYVGEIYPLLPIPLTPSGTTSVQADYIWFVNPALEFAGLNTRGLGLNLWDRAAGHTAGALAPLPGNSTGATKNNRFPMGVVLGPYVRPTPKIVAHSYIGFQRGGYSALLNEPTTLLLNRNPHAISIGKVSAEALTQSGTFNGRSLPEDAETPWSLVGQDSGSLLPGGTYRVIDTLSGPYGVGQPAYYRRQFDLALNGVLTQVGRFQVRNWVLDGVFTGVGLGVYTGRHLFLVGALVVSGVKHLGILLNGEDPQLEASWKIGPACQAAAYTQTQISVSSSSFPLGVSPGTRFRISTGAQAGIYEISECGIQASTGGNILISIEPPLPADVSFWGNSDFEILFEVPWEDLVSVRAQVSFLEGSAQAYLSGSISGLIGDVSTLTPYPAQTSLVLPALEKAVALWGSLSRKTRNTSDWDFVKYTYTPEKVLNTVQGLTVNTEMGVVPQEDPNDPWYIRGGYGYAGVQPAGNQTLIKSTSAPVFEDLDLEFAYERVEPYFSNRVTLDLDAKFQVESGRLGAGDVEVLLNDGVREVCFKTLLYVQGTYPIPPGGTETGRRLVADLPQASLSGLQYPEASGWTLTGQVGSPEVYPEGQKLRVEKTSGAGVVYSRAILDPVEVSYQGLISELEVQILSGTPSGSSGIGLLSGARVRNLAGSQTRLFLLGFSAGSLVFLDRNLNLVQSVPFAWSDGAKHTYRTLLDPASNSVVLVVDDVVTATAALNLFPAGAEPPEAVFRLAGSGEVSALVYSTSCIPLRPVAKPGSLLGRTFGILLEGGDPTKIDGYRIPRSDASGAPNSSLVAIPVPMDWRNSLHSRLYMDPTWGVTFYRPDIPPPPAFTGNFATQTTDPTAAWVSVEYAELPVYKKPRGTVVFGSPNPQAITQSRWDFLRYKIRGDIDGFGIAPQNMTLNRAFVVTSGEFLNDETPEVRTVLSRTSTLVKVSDSAIYARRVFGVQVAGAVLPSSAWSFDAATQVLVLNTPLPEPAYPVTVTFSAGPPYTKEYLCSQPVWNSPTQLNAGTPPVPKSRDSFPTSGVFPGSPINDPADILDSEETPAPPDYHQFVGFQEDPDSLYASMEFCEKEEGEDVYISPICDGPGPGLGLAEIGISGSFTANEFSVEGGPGGTWGGRSPVISGSSAHFNQSTVLIASGGSYQNSTLGPALNMGMVLYPNARANNWAPLSGSSGSMGLNQDFAMSLVTVTPYAETWGAIFGDNVPPTSADPATNPNPDGVPGIFGGGAAAYIIEDYSTSPFSRLGPWVGLADLSVRSLLAGGAPLPGTEFVLEGGAPLPLISVVTSGVLEAAN